MKKIKINIIKHTFKNIKTKIKHLSSSRIIMFGAIIFVGLFIFALILVLNTSKGKYDVTFDPTGGVAIAEKTVLKNGRLEEPPTPTKRGFVFVEWQLDGKRYDFNKIVTANIILTAVWMSDGTTEIVQISFNTNGGTPIKDIEIAKGEKISPPINPTLVEHTFKGWYYKDQKFNFDIVINEDITLNAKWERNTTSGLDLNNKNDNNCVGGASASVPEKKVSIGYSDHLNWTFSTGMSYSTNSCYITYKSSDINIATISDKGTINALSEGSTYMYSCINDTETKNEIACFKGKLIVEDSSNEKAGKSLVNAINGYYWYLDGYKNTYLYPTVIDWYDHQLLQWESENINISNKEITPLESLNSSEYYSVVYQASTNTHNALLINPVEFAYLLIDKYNMHVSNNKLYMTVGGKQYIFTKYTSKKAVDVNFSFDQSSINVNRYDSFNIVANVTPFFANYNLTASSSDSSIVTLTNNGGRTNEGKVTFTFYANKAGVSVITVKDSNSGMSKTLNVNVNNVTIPVNGISLNLTNLPLTRGTTYYIPYTFMPSNATNQGVTWESSNSEVATVDRNGKVTAIKKGNAVITAKTTEGNYTDSCEVTVNNPDLTVNPSIGYSMIFSSGGMSPGIQVTLDASGGSGIYTYYFIKLYKEGSLIGETINTSSNQLFVGGYKNGSYYVEYIVKDSENNEKTGTSSTILIQ